MTKDFGIEIYLQKNYEGPEELQESAEKAPEVELFIEPLTGLAIPMPRQNKRGHLPPIFSIRFW